MRGAHKVLLVVAAAAMAGAAAGPPAAAQPFVFPLQNQPKEQERPVPAAPPVAPPQAGPSAPSSGGYAEQPGPSGQQEEAYQPSAPASGTPPQQ